MGLMGQVMFVGVESLELSIVNRGKVRTLTFPVPGLLFVYYN
jgi:hypothetical protein